LLALNQFLSGALRRDFGLIWQIVSLGFISLAGGLIYILSARLIQHPDLISSLDMIVQIRTRSTAENVSPNPES